jgi:hypothetical protein
MITGTYQLGGWVPLPVLTGTSWPLDVSGVRVIPSLSIFDESFDYVVRDEPVVPVLSETGMHMVQRRLGPEFSTGTYEALITWDDAGSLKGVRRRFEVVAGGDAGGAYVGLSFFDGRNSAYLVGMTDGGLVEARKGPKV